MSSTGGGSKAATSSSGCRAARGTPLRSGSWPTIRGRTPPPQLGRSGLSYDLNAAGLHGALAGELSFGVNMSAGARDQGTLLRDL